MFGQTKRKHLGKKIVIEILILLFFALLSAIFFRQILSGRNTFVLPFDTSDLIYPDYYYIAKSLKEGIFPLWNPHIFGGVTLIGYPQYGLLYPINIIFWLLPYASSAFPYQAYEWIVVFHIFLSGYFMYLLGRQLKFNRPIAAFIGTAYALTPGLVMFSGWGNQITAFAWFPLLFLFLHRSFQERRKYASWAAGLILGIIILATPAQPAIQAMMIVAGYAVIEFLQRNSKKLSIAINTGIVFFLGFVVGALSLLPIMESIPDVVRFLGAEGVAIGNATPPLTASMVYKLQSSDLLGLIFPSAARQPVSRTFFGIAPLVFSLYGMFAFVRKNAVVRFFTILALVSAVYASGFLLPQLFHVIPFVNKIREPQRFVILIAFALPILSGYGLTHLLSFRNSQKNANPAL